MIAPGALKLNLGWERFSAHYAPHLVDVRERVKVFVVMEIKRAFHRKAVNPVVVLNKAEQFRDFYFKAVHLFQRNPEKLFERF